MKNITQFILLGSFLISIVTGQTSDDIDLGRRLYQEGILASGAPVQATLLDEIPAQGAAFCCASCHRRSGFGGSEGEIYTPPITALDLFRDRHPERKNLIKPLFQEVRPSHTRAQLQNLSYRPAYTEATLADALRHGITPDGQSLHHLMPKYPLSKTDLRCLSAYLHTLGQKPSPGIDPTTIHFATIISDEVAPTQEKAFLDVLLSYTKRKNTDTQSKILRPHFSPHYKDTFSNTFRTWKIHQWKLTGSPQTWPQQLNKFYKEQPVFALLSGLSNKSWRPIHEFCESHQLPCLFPNTSLPFTHGKNLYTPYLSRGLFGEAEALAHHFAQKTPQAILQIHGGKYHLKLARHLQSRVPSWDITTLERQPNTTKPEAKHLILWLDSEDLQSLDLTLPAITNASHIYLSGSTISHNFSKIPPSIRTRCHLVWPYTIPGQEPARIYRARSWLRSRRIVDPVHEFTQLNTYFALTLADHALVHLVENYDQDYFIETIEHETENALNPGVFPHLSLGPGQRYASKGYRLVKPHPSNIQLLTPTGNQIIPEP